MPAMQPILYSNPVIQRYRKGEPILSAKEIPYPANLIFNAGVTKYQGKYIMTFRNDYGYTEEKGFEGTSIGLAFSDNGIDWEVQNKPCFVLHDKEIRRAYDPRLTVIEGVCYMCFAVDTEHGIRGGIASTEDFEHFDIHSISAPDNRNMVLFPERIGGQFVRLERPMPVYSRGKDQFDTWISRSPDLRYWGDYNLLLGVENVPFANDKVGPAAPPIKTDKGWLTLFHAVDIDPERGKNGWEEKWTKRYSAGIMLLDLEDPTKVISISQKPLIAPETKWETDEGFRTNVIFPGGMILEDDGEVKIYYGASDTVECLATAQVDDLIKAALNEI